MRIKVSDIHCDLDVYPRSGTNPFFVHRMIDALEAGAEFPPIVIEQSTCRLVDGWHRHAVYLTKGIKDTPAIAKTYLNNADLFADAVRLNIAHGIPLTAYDMRAAVARLESLGYSRDRIGEVVKIPLGKIDEIVKGFAASPEGEPIALKGGLRHMKGQALTPRQMKALQHYGGHQSVFYIRQLIMLLTEDLWPREHPSFKHEMNELVRLWTTVAAAESDLS